MNTISPPPFCLPGISPIPAFPNFQELSFVIWRFYSLLFRLLSWLLMLAVASTRTKRKDGWWGGNDLIPHHPCCFP